jgi:short-subunit dehydrogenase
MAVQDRVVVVTGASSGIGAALAALLAKKGDAVVLVSRNADALRETAERIGGTAVVVAADVTQRENVRRVVAEALARHDRIDVWVNNVGQGITRLPSQLTDADVDDMMRINVKSALYGMQEVLPHFKERGTGQIVNVSSMLGRIPYALFRSAYTASKHYLNALTAMMREEVRQTHPDIQFSIVSPPVVRTNFGLNALHGGPDSRILPNSQSADEVAAVIAGVIESRQADVYTRRGSHQRVVEYYGSVGSDPPGA